MSEDSLKALVRSDLPPHAFDNRPWRTLWFVPISVSILALSALLAFYELPWYGAVTLSLVLGHQYGSLFFFAHELSHQSMSRSRRLQNVLLYFCYWIYCMPPSLMVSWHFAGHHAHTNVAERDTDTFGLVEDFRRTTRTEFLFRFTPGSGHWLSALYLFTFALQVQVLLWFRITGTAYSGYSRARAAVESALMAALWLTICVIVGPRQALLIVGIPMGVASFVILSYGATNHSLRPLTTNADPLRGSMSVSTVGILDRLHFYFSHHIEHHMFPSMGSCYAPLARRSLQKHAGDAYLAPPQWKALIAVFLTPRLYQTADVLVNPYTGRQVPIRAIESALRAPGMTGLRGLLSDCQPPAISAVRGR